MYYDIRVLLYKNILINPIIIMRVLWYSNTIILWYYDIPSISLLEYSNIRVLVYYDIGGRQGTGVGIGACISLSYISD